jgi:hypothetical protein
MTDNLPDMFYKQARPQELNALLDRLSGATAAFVRTAHRYCRARSSDSQRELRVGLDECLDCLIDIYSRCEVVSDAIANDAARHGPGYELNLWRRAVAISDIVVQEQADAIRDIAARQRQPL